MKWQSIVDPLLCAISAELFRHPLLIALVQLLVGGLAAYFLTERWQRWRQRRDFQHRAMVKCGEVTMEQFELLSELLTRRTRGAAPEWTSALGREYLAHRVKFHALEGELLAVFQAPGIMQTYRALKETAQTFATMVSSGETLDRQGLKPIQQRFLAQRQLLTTRMVAEMGFLSETQLRAAERELKLKAATDG
jgi:hypothetical protein